MRGNLKHLSNRRFDVVNNPMQALEHVFIAITFFQIALRFYDFAAVCIILLSPFMNWTIKFNRHARLKTNKINNEAFNRKLSSEFVTVQFSIP